MTIEKELLQRSEEKCEICTSVVSLQLYEVQPARNTNAEDCCLLCTTCLKQYENSDQPDVNHWRCLKDSMWTPIPAVQVISYRMMNRLKAEPWALELLDMMYLDEETLAWANSGLTERDEKIVHVDSNGIVLETGDSVVLIQDLKVKGANFTAKRGTAVRRISLDPYNAEHIEGKVDGQRIVILTKFVKKAK